MKKTLFILASVVLFAFGVVSFANNNSQVAKEIDGKSVKFTKEEYPIKPHHEHLRMECKDCHGDGPKEEYTALSTNDCLTCHKDYSTLAERTEFLGYDDNIHASPHYPKMDCNLCHASHKPTQNYCVMCHSQDTMKNLLVP